MGVSVLTLHEAKGLEFRVVFVLAAEEGSLPHDLALAEGPDAVEEERRLLYVGVTRAREALYLMMASRRGGSPRRPSRFLDMIRWC
jgi:DNA helicase-2/ATP-dependent DNA helicase PcrA